MAETGDWATRRVGGSLPQASRLQITEQLQRQGNTFYVDLTATFDVVGLYDHAQVWASINGSSFVNLGSTPSRRFDWRGGVSDTYQIEIRPFDALGRIGGTTAAGYTVVGLSSPPGDVPWFAIEGNTLSWGAVPDADLAGYLLRYHYGFNRSWGDANPLHAGLITQSPFTPDSTPQGALTLLVKAVDTSGNESGTAAVINTKFGDVIVANVVETKDFKSLSYPGTLTGGALIGGQLKADGTSVFYGAEAADFFKQGDSLAFYVDNFNRMVYETEVFTPSAAALGSNMTLNVDASGEAVFIEYRTSGANAMFPTIGSDPFYGDDATSFYGMPDVYQPWPGQVAAKNLQYQFRITTGQSAAQGVINTCNAVIDVPDKTEKINNFVVASGGVRLPISAGFQVIENVQLTLETDGGGAVYMQILDKNPTLGPLIACYNASGAATSGKVDAIVQGY